MDEIVGTYFSVFLQDSPSLFSAYWVEEKLVEEAFRGVDRVLDPNGFRDILVYEFPSGREEERSTC